MLDNRLPDRMSCYPSSEHWSELSRDNRLTVRLDGVKLYYITEYCVSEGWLIQYRRDENDKFIIEGNKLATDKLCGNVTVTLERS